MLATLVLAGFSLITVGCALLFPDRPEELDPARWRLLAPAPAPAE